MPFRKKWSKLTSAKLKKVPHRPGSYELASRNKTIVDIGGSERSVRKRLAAKRRQHPTANFFRYVTASIFGSGFEIEARHSRKFSKKHGRKPKYTKRSPKRKGFFDL
jgi:hypothetical protein